MKLLRRLIGNFNKKKLLLDFTHSHRFVFQRIFTIGTNSLVDAECMDYCVCADYKNTHGTVAVKVHRTAIVVQHKCMNPPHHSEDAALFLTTFNRTNAFSWCKMVRTKDLG